MKQIIQITLRLTISCLVTAFMMGSVFIITDRAKKHNEHENFQETTFDLLGYNKNNPAPPDLKSYYIYRYIIADGDSKYLGYMLPVKKGNEENYKLLVIDLQGKFIDLHEMDISPEEAMEGPKRKKALKIVLPAPRTFTYADATIIAKLGDKRIAYLLPGKFPGFKTFISVMLALDPSFNILGLEIMEHEEDPGLGAEIEQDYFKKQFSDKTFAKMKDIKVIKEPLPEEYRKFLETEKQGEGAISKKEIEEIRNKYRDKDIYALTGATISSKSVTVGVKNMVKKFAYRVKILDNVVAGRKIPVAF